MKVSYCSASLNIVLFMDKPSNHAKLWLMLFIFAIPFEFVPDQMYGAILNESYIMPTYSLAQVTS